MKAAGCHALPSIRSADLSSELVTSNTKLCRSSSVYLKLVSND